MKSILKKLIGVKTRRRILEFFNRLWCAVCRRLPLRNVVLFYTIRADGRLLDNAKAVYDAYEGKKIVFAHMLPHSVKLKPLAYYYLLTSRVIVTDDYVRYMRAVKLREGQKLFQIWHACGAFKKFGLDAPSRLTPTEERATHSQYSAVAVTGEGCRKFYAGAFGISEDICLPIGLPRTDKILNGADGLKNSILEKCPQLKGKRIYLYCPTFREKDGNNVEYDPAIDWESLSAGLADDEVFVIRRHPIMNYRLCGGEYKNIIDLSEQSTLELIAACSVLITDYSSVIYDACLLDVPTVFYCPDYRDYERGFYLSFPDDLPGEMVTDGKMLIDAVRNAEKNPPVSKIEKFRNEQMSACDGHAAERVAAIIRDWMK